MNEFKAVCLQDAFDLAASMHGPRPGGIEFYVCLPVFESLARLANLLVRERKIVVCVGVGGSQLKSGLIGLNGFLHTAGLVEHVAQVEVC